MQQVVVGIGKKWHNKVDKRVFGMSVEEDKVSRARVGINVMCG